MASITTLVQTATYDTTPAALRLPSPLWTAFALLNKAHSVWRWIRRIELYRNPENLAQLLAGHVVNFALGDVLLLRIAAQCLLISTRVLECVQQQTTVYHAGKRWIAAIKGDYPKPTQNIWDTHYATRGETVKSCLKNRMERIVRSTLSLFKHTFILSMCLMDAVDAFCLSPFTRNEGINEGFVNAIKWLDTLTENKEELLQGLVDNQPIIEKILAKSPFTYKQLHDGVERTLERTETIALKAKNISRVGNGILVDMGKRMVNGTLIVLGLPFLARA
jgi:hypothetical protein